MKEILNFTSSRYPEVLLQDLTPLKKVENLNKDKH